MKLMKTIFFVGLFISWAFLVGLFISSFNSNGAIPNVNNLNLTNISGQLGGQTLTLDLQEVGKHNTLSNCWMIINSKVYDITSYSNSHPGGRSALEMGCGIDATQLYDSKGGRSSGHSSFADSLLQSYYLGDLNQKVSSSQVDSQVNNIKNNTPAYNYDDEEDD
jgi:cytochrome b involved in lipid metabolism